MGKQQVAVLGLGDAVRAVTLTANGAAVRRCAYTACVFANVRYAWQSHSGLMCGMCGPAAATGRYKGLTKNICVNIYRDSQRPSLTHSLTHLLSQDRGGLGGTRVCKLLP